jgi:putative ABC transport system ATP-binding protein
MAPSDRHFLHIDGLTKGYGTGDARVEVLRGISCDIDAGEICVLFGPSGSGKSTFLNLVGGLEPADGGQIVVGGTDICQLRDRELVDYRRRELGFIFQFYNLVPDLTIAENIEVCQYLSADPLPIDGLLESLGIFEHRNKFPNQVSGGQQQRCAIGRALVKNPRLLLCDEPTGALDYHTSKEILELMERINQTYGTTMVVVTHNDAIRHMSHHILRLRDGALVEDVHNDALVPARELSW